MADNALDLKKIETTIKTIKEKTATFDQAAVAFVGASLFAAKNYLRDEGHSQQSKQTVIDAINFLKTVVDGGDLSPHQNHGMVSGSLEKEEFNAAIERVQSSCANFCSDIKTRLQWIMTVEVGILSQYPVVSLPLLPFFLATILVGVAALLITELVTRSVGAVVGLCKKTIYPHEPIIEGLCSTASYVLSMKNKSVSREFSSPTPEASFHKPLFSSVRNEDKSSCSPPPLMHEWARKEMMECYAGLNRRKLKSS